MAKKRILHVISGLQVGGAERSLFTLLNSELNSEYQFAVISLVSEGYYGPKLKSLGIPLYCCHLKSPFGIFYTFNAIVRSILFNPSIIHGWMYHGNLLAWIIRILLPSSYLHWNIRTCINDRHQFPFVLSILLRLNKFLSTFVDVCVFNSTLSLRQHVQYGFKFRSAKVIYNGFDSHSWPDTSASLSLARQKLNISISSFVFGFVGRGHYRKDVPTLISAFNQFKIGKPHALLVCIGSNVKTNLPLALDLSQVIFIDHISDLQVTYLAFDVLCLSSIVEGFPNVLAEAMLCGVPCITTDVGDSAFIVGESGWVVKASSPTCFAEAMEIAYRLPRHRLHHLGLLSRSRIVQYFSIDSMLDSYSSLYSAISSS